MKFRRMSFVLCMLLFFVSSISAYAAQCELGISLGEKGSAVELSVYKTADIEDGEYVWLQEFEGVDVDLKNVSSAAETKAAAEKIYQWSTEKNVQPTQSGTTDENGTVSFTVDSGVYVIAKVSEKGSMAPVLLILPEEQLEAYMVLSPKFSVSEGEKEPEGPDNPENPDNPDKPVNPENPDNPDNPDKPVNPENPNKPAKPNQPNKGTNAQTGDSANILLWLSVLVVALAGIVVVIKKNHGKR